jgi:hypothetical protein
MTGSASAASRWQAVIDEYRQSGLKQAEFCRQRGLSLLTFRKYLYRSRPVATSNPVVEFLPVSTPTTPQAPQRDPDPLVLILADGRRVAVAPGFDPQTLRRLIETIEGLA